MMKSNDLIVNMLILINSVVGFYIVKNRMKRKRSVWTRKWLKRREVGRGSLNLLNRELKFEDPASYKNFLRLNNQQFVFLKNLIEDDIKKTDTLMRPSISAEERLNITLRFLATGESYRSLMYSMRVHESTISKIVPEVCKSIFKHLRSTYLTSPKTEAEWLKIASEFEMKWNFPHCIGALDGRHITFAAPISSGSYYYNYKGSHSIVLMGLVDANYRFLYVNVEGNGRISGGGIFQACTLFNRLEDETLNLPPPSPLSGGQNPVPYVLVADDAFPLMNNLMKPYPQRGLDYQKRIYNYRLSRARRMVESAFGVLANRWRVLLNPIHLNPEKVETITLACVALHNFLATESLNYIPENIKNEIFDLNLNQIGVQGCNRTPNSCLAIRESFKAFFNSLAGSVAWQDVAVRRGNG